MPMIHKIVPCLWFDTQAEEAAKLYCSIIEGSRITHVSHYGKVGQEVTGKAPGSVMTVAFELAGVPLTALNGGPMFKFNEAMSLQVMCETQAEIDRYWDALNQGGDPRAQQCGWLKDKFGLSWQIVPSILPKLLEDRDADKAGRAMGAMMHMKKLDIAALEKAHAG